MLPAATLHIESAIDSVGGSFHSLEGLLLSLDRGQFEPTVVFARDCDNARRLREHGISVHVLPEPPVRPLAPGRMAFHRQLLVATAACSAIIRDLERRQGRAFDLVHANDQLVTNAGWILASQFSGRPVVCHERQYGDFRAVHRWIARRAAAHVRISRSVDQHCHQTSIVSRNDLIVHNGVRCPTEAQRIVAAEQGRKTLAEKQIGVGRAVILAPATLVPWKGADLVVRALAYLGHRRRTLPDLVFVGSASREAPDWSDRVALLARELGVADYVRRIGYREDVVQLMAAAQVVVHGARRPEPFGRVPLEAMAWGTPVVATQTGAVEEVLGSSHPGLVPVDHPEAMADALEMALQRSSFLENAVEEGKQRAAREFSLVAHVKRMASVFADALGSGWSATGNAA